MVRVYVGWAMGEKRVAFNHVVVGLIPTDGVLIYFIIIILPIIKKRENHSGAVMSAFCISVFFGLQGWFAILIGCFVLLGDFGTYIL